MKRPIKLSLAIALALGTSQAWALGLGSITVRSGLNEPLVAEIAVNVMTPGEAEAMRANLASAADFERVGLDISGVSVPLNFDVVKGKDGRTIIQVTSESPVREPFLSFLVEASWPNGRVLREYSLLLDPPSVAPAIIGTRTVIEPVQEAAPAPAQALPPSVIDEKPVAAAPSELAAPVEATPAPVAQAPTAPPPPPSIRAPTPAPAEQPAPAPVAAAPAPAPAQPGEYGPVAAGETLWEIATATRAPGSVTLNQMMLAILRANPDAFIRDNVNLLKRGAVLRIPNADEARSTAVADAAAEIAAQHATWQSTRAPTLIADTGSAIPSRTPAPSPARDASRLELVPPRAGTGRAASGDDSPGAAGGTDTSAQARTDLARAREQLASREQESTELRSRVKELERLQGDSSRLVNLKDSEIAELQRRLKKLQEETEQIKTRAASIPTGTAVTPAPVASTPEPVAPIAATPPTPEPTVEAKPESAATNAAAAGGSFEPIASVDPATPKKDPRPAAAVIPVPDAPVSPATPLDPRPAMPWWRNTMVLIGASGALLLGGLLLLLLRGRRKPAPVVAAVGRGSVADSFSSGVFGGRQSSGGDDDETAFLEQLAGDPTDLESHLALLRHYYGQGDAEKYEAAAGAMYAQLSDTTDPAWVEACVMGRELVPGNSMFEVEGGSAFNFDQIESSDSSGFDLGSSEIEPIAESREPEPFDFSLEEPEVSNATQSAATTRVERSDADSFRTAELEKPKREAPAAPPPAPADSSAFFDGDDAVGTKLDLARAYMDMGDPEGARSMLQEVIAEGSDQQKQEARRLLSEIG